MVVAKDLREDQTCVVVCPDNIRNYMTKFVVDNWLEARNLKESPNIQGHSWWDRTVKEMITEQCASSFLSMSSSASCQKVIDELKSQKFDQILIVDDDGKLLGLATTAHLTNKILDNSLNPLDPIEKALFKKFTKISTDASVGKLSRILEIEPLVVAVLHAYNKEDCEYCSNLLKERKFKSYFQMAKTTLRKSNMCKRS